jgi:uncharacterized protein (TIGR03546 family)
MTLLLKQIFNLIRLLHSENGTTQIAWGLTLGTFLGFSPFFSLQTFLILIVLLIFRVQFGAAFLSAFFFKFVAFLIDPIADILGRYVLEAVTVRDLWTTLYNIPLVPYTRFNNSIVMGSFFFALLISPFMYWGFQYLIRKYRDHVVKRFENSKAWKAFKASKFYVWYMKYDDLYGTQS